MPRVVSCRVLIKDKKEIYIAAGKKSCLITEAVYFLKYIRQFNLLFGSLSGVGRYYVCMCVLDVSRCSFCLSREWKGLSVTQWIGLIVIQRSGGAGCGTSELRDVRPCWVGTAFVREIWKDIWRAF